MTLLLNGRYRHTNPTQHFSPGVGKGRPGLPWGLRYLALRVAAGRGEWMERGRQLDGNAVDGGCCIGTSLDKVPIYPCFLGLQYSEWPP